MRRPVLAAGATLILIAVGCAQPLPEPPYMVRPDAGGGVRTVVPTPTPTSRPPGPTPTQEKPMADLPQPVQKAVSELAQDQNVPVAEVEVLEWRRVEWRDASLGCPEPGMMYAQVVTPGYLARLRAAGQTYEYHTDTAGRAVTCRDPQPPLSGGS